MFQHLFEQMYQMGPLGDINFARSRKIHLLHMFKHYEKTVFPPSLTSRRKSKFLGLNDLQTTNEEAARSEFISE